MHDMLVDCTAIISGQLSFVVNELFTTCKGKYLSVPHNNMEFIRFLAVLLSWILLRKEGN